jgi:hypothetical protein
MEIIMKHTHRLVMFIALLLLAGCAGTVPKDLDIQTDSVVVGCIENPVIAPHGFYYYENSGAMPEWRLKNMRLRDLKSNKVVDLFLLRNGCFTTEVVPGIYSFEHFIKGTKYYRHDKESFIGQVNVPAGRLVNLGAYHMEVFNIEFYRWARGDYPVIAGYTGDKKFHQLPGKEFFTGTLDWFRELNPEVYEKYKDRVVEWKQGGQ